MFELATNFDLVTYNVIILYMATDVVRYCVDAIGFRML